MCSDSLGNKMPAGHSLALKLRVACFCLLIVEPHATSLLLWWFSSDHRKTKIKHPNGCLYFSWRMVRDSNPRWSCPHNGFQDRRIRPLCQPSETVFRRSFNLRFWCSHDAVMFALHFADARSQDTHASPRSANHPKLRTVCIVYYFFLQCKYKNSDV